MEFFTSSHTLEISILFKTKAKKNISRVNHKDMEAREMAQSSSRLKVLAAKPDDWSWIPESHVVKEKSRHSQMSPFECPPWCVPPQCTHKIKNAGK